MDVSFGLRSYLSRIERPIRTIDGVLDSRRRRATRKRSLHLSPAPVLSRAQTPTELSTDLFETIRNAASERVSACRCPPPRPSWSPTDFPLFSHVPDYESYLEVSLETFLRLSAVGHDREQCLWESEARVRALFHSRSKLRETLSDRGSVGRGLEAATRSRVSA